MIEDQPFGKRSGVKRVPVNESTPAGDVVLNVKAGRVAAAGRVVFERFPSAIGSAFQLRQATRLCD